MNSSKLECQKVSKKRYSRVSTRVSKYSLSPLVNTNVVARICASRRFKNLGFPLGRWDPIWFSYRRLHCHGFSNSRGHPNQWFCRQRETITGEILFFCDYLFQMKLYHFFVCKTGHTIRKYKKMAGQNTFQVLLLNDANMVEEH